MAEHSEISVQLLVDCAEFLAWLASQKIIEYRRYTDSQEKSEGQVNVRDLAILEGQYPEQGNSDWTYWIAVNGTMLWDSKYPDPEPWYFIFSALTVPLTSRAADGWRPYYGSRRPSWDPRHGLPTPIFRAKSGAFTVFDMPVGDLWDGIVRNPGDHDPTSRIEMQIGAWMALSEFVRHERLRGDDTLQLWASVAPYKVEGRLPQPVGPRQDAMFRVFEPFGGGPLDVLYVARNGWTVTAATL